MAACYATCVCEELPVDPTSSTHPLLQVSPKVNYSHLAQAATSARDDVQALRTYIGGQTEGNISAVSLVPSVSSRDFGKTGFTIFRCVII